MVPVAEEILRSWSNGVIVGVFGIMYKCWKCGRNAPAATTIRCETFGEGFIAYDDETNLRYAKELLVLADDRLGCSIKPRYSKTLGRSYLSNGCCYCDALFGNYPLFEELSDRAVSGERESKFLSMRRPTSEWLVMAGFNSDRLFANDD